MHTKLKTYEEGDAFVTRSCKIARGEVAQFSLLTGDRHPQHLDPEWARNSPFGQCIVSGTHLIACAIGLMELDTDRVVALRGIKDLTFKRPVPVGDEISVCGCVLETHALNKEVAVATLSFWVVRSDERVALRGKMDALVRVGEAGA
jgi:acyl dehydratase